MVRNFWRFGSEGQRHRPNERLPILYSFVHSYCPVRKQYLWHSGFQVHESSYNCMYNCVKKLKDLPVHHHPSVLVLLCGMCCRESGISCVEFDFVRIVSLDLVKVTHTRNSPSLGALRIHTFILQKYSRKSVSVWWERVITSYLHRRVKES